MSKVENKTGSCLCKAVSFKVAELDTSLHACHCGMCAKYGGGPSLSFSCGKEIEFKGKEHIKEFRSSDWASRGFCSSCGTHLYYKFVESKEYLMCPGIFDEEIAFVFEEQIFIDKKPSYYDFANKTHNLTEKEVIER
jgi:hypothetical protein